MWRDATRRRAARCRSWLLTSAPPRRYAARRSAPKAGTVRAPEHHNAYPAGFLPLGSPRRGWSSAGPECGPNTPQRVLFPIDNVRLGSARGDRRVATPPEFVYRHNSLVGHALLWGRMHDELQQDFRSADRGRAWRRNRWRRSPHGHSPTRLLARSARHCSTIRSFFFHGPASDPGAASRLRPPVLVSCRSRFRRARGGGSAHPRGPQGALRDAQFRRRLGTPMSVISNGRRSARCFTHTKFQPSVVTQCSPANNLASEALSDGMKACSAG